MKKIVLIISLIHYSCLLIGQVSQRADDYRHILSHSELDTGIYHYYSASSENGEKIFDKVPATIGTYYDLYIRKFGEEDFNRILNLSPNDLAKELNSEENLTKKWLMNGVRGSYNNFTDDLKFRYNGETYVMTYEPVDEIHSGNYFSRDLNLYQWAGYYNWEKVNNKPIPVDTIPSDNLEIRYSITTNYSDVFSIRSKTYPNFDHEVIGMIVGVYFEYRKKAKVTEIRTIGGVQQGEPKRVEKKVFRSGWYSQLVFFVKGPLGFDIRVKPINRKNLWFFNSDFLPEGEYYKGVKDRNTLYLHMRTNVQKLDGGGERPIKTAKIEYNVLTDKVKYIRKK